jgi:hypothetical protein
MMAIDQLYHNWLSKTLQLRPKERITRVRNVARLMTGIFESKSVHLSKSGDENSWSRENHQPHQVMASLSRQWCRTSAGVT